MFHTKKGNLSLSVYNEKTNVYESGLTGECIAAFTYEKLLFKYWNLDTESYDALSEDDEKRHLPKSLQKDWAAFKSLYNETFNSQIGNYEIICSSGVERL